MRYAKSLFHSAHSIIANVRCNAIAVLDVKWMWSHSTVSLIRPFATLFVWILGNHCSKSLDCAKGSLTLHCIPRIRMWRMSLFLTYGANFVITFSPDWSRHRTRTNWFSSRRVWWKITPVSHINQTRQFVDEFSQHCRREQLSKCDNSSHQPSNRSGTLNMKKFDSSFSEKTKFFPTEYLMRPIYCNMVLLNGHRTDCTRYYYYFFFILNHRNTNFPTASELCVCVTERVPSDVNQQWMGSQ